MCAAGVSSHWCAAQVCAAGVSSAGVCSRSVGASKLLQCGRRRWGRELLEPERPLMLQMEAEGCPPSPSGSEGKGKDQNREIRSKRMELI